MKQKERRSVAKLTLIWALFLLLTALISFVDLLISRNLGAFTERLLIGTQVFILVYPVMLGLSLFMDEQKQKGMEYLLSLPVSRQRILWAKLAPRLAALAISLLVYASISLVDPGSFQFMAPLPFILVNLVLFIIALSLSLWFDRLLISFLGFGIGLLVYAGLAAAAFLMAFQYALTQGLVIQYVKTPRSLLENLVSSLELPPWVTVASFTIMLAPFAGAFWAVARRLDIRSCRMAGLYLRRFSLTLAVTLPLAVILMVLNIRPQRFGGNFFYLTADRQVLERKGDRLVIHTPESVRIMKGLGHAQTIPLGDGDGWVYLDRWSADEEDIVRVQPRTLKLEVAYRFRSQETLTQGSFFYLDDQALFLIEEKSGRQSEANSLKASVAVSAGNRVPLVRKIREEKVAFQRLIGFDEWQRRRFWLSRRYSDGGIVQRIWEDGTVEKLTRAGGSAFYHGGKLVTFGDMAASLYEWDETGALQKRAEIPGRFNPRFPRRSRLPLQKGVGQFLIFQEGSNPLCLDLIQPAVTPVSLGPGMDRARDLFSQALVYIDDQSRPVYMTVADQPGELVFSRLEDCTWQLVGRIAIGVTGWKKIHDNFWNNSHGVVVRKRGRLHAFLYPDLRQITLK